MNDRTFDRPVFVKNGEYMIQEIACLADAFDFLDDWPKNRWGIIYETALRACRSAHDNHVPLSVARAAFAGFAKSVNILEDVFAAMPWMTAPKAGRGGVAV